MRKSFRQSLMIAFICGTSSPWLSSAFYIWLHFLSFSPGVGVCWTQDENPRVVHWVSEWASEARGWQGFKDWLVIASTCFPPEWFWNWQFQILSLDKSSDCSGIAKVEAHIGRNAICPGYVTFYRNSLFAAEICQNESIFSHITTWATFRDKYSWWLERVGGLAGSLGQKLPAPVMNYSIVGMERED